MAQHAMITKPGQGCCLANVSYSRTLNQHHAFPDDRVEFQVEIVNRKPLPLTSLRVVETVAAALDWGDTPFQYHEKPSLRLLERTTSLRWYEALRWRYQVRCPQRGAFAFGPTTLEAGDPFGFTTQELTVANPIELVVYPRLLARVALAGLDLALLGLALALLQAQSSPASLPLNWSGITIALLVGVAVTA